MSKLDDIKFMTMAIELAKKGNYRTHPNPLVGAVIVKDNKILSKGFHRRFRGKHAEREAIDKTKHSLRDATMYVTLEPCCHHGNTPPCVDLIIKNKLSRVVIASKDPNPLVNEKSINKLRDNGIEVTTGICENEAIELNKSFFYKFSHKQKLQDIALSLGFSKPKLLQSMYIFKQPKIGGEVVCHQDSTFLYTEPESTIGFWFALEDANKTNGCLQVASGGHKGPLRKLFKKVDGKMQMIDLNDEPFPETDTFVEVKKGSLVLLHGRLPHYSCENTSLKSRHAYTIHVIDNNNQYPEWNWLQRSSIPLKSFIND